MQLLLALSIVFAGTSLGAVDAAAHGRPQAPADPAPSDAWDDFPALLWHGSRQDAVISELARALGGTLVIGAAPYPKLLAEQLAGEPAFLVFNAAGRDALHLDEATPGVRERRARWIETRDDALLVRRPCLSAAESREHLFATLDASLAARDGRQGLGISLGDEVSLTPNGSPWDGCLGEACRARWVEYLASRADLDDARRARYADPRSGSTDAARAALAEGETGALEPWLLRRDFHQSVVDELLLELAARSRARRPEVPVGLLGLIGRTTFGGVDLDRVLPALDFVECYVVSDARERMFTDCARGVRTLQTVFPGTGHPDRAAWRTFEHWLRGGDGVVVWSDRELRDDPAARTRLERALADLRGVVRQVGPLRPGTGGVAVVQSDASVAVDWLREALLDGPTWPNRLQGSQERDGARESSLRNWLRLLEDQGLLPGALDVERIDAATVARFPVLVLHRLAVLDDADLQRLHAFLDGGGTLVADGPLGELDRRGRRRADDALEALRARAPERVHAAPPGIADYARLRLRAPVRAQETREACAELFDAAAPHRAPFRVEVAAPERERAIGWLVAATPVPDEPGALVCAALPNRPEAPPRLEIEVHVDDQAYAVEWIHPSLGAGAPASVGAGAPASTGVALHRILPPGDAAVFRLVPRR